ncbi:hypothetical protein [Mycobacterium sp.]|uniref:hypothetical protein n=1 Tax=Mycobacterium sp. TaxID=1785 RepID=UPI0012010E8F|nr:hypothetical protein [Mycobacterium sp.]TAM69801.1 MAG: hypothetical protein EPN51_08600 [Mycobacterium sp.]
MTTILATIPQPPVDAVMPKTAETIFNIFIFIPLGIALALALRKLFKGQGPLLLYCILGGALAASFEPVVDVLGLVFLKEQGALGTFTILDRTMPLYICFVYPWYVGGLGYLAYKLFKRGVTMRDLFLLWASDFLVDIFLESPGILAGTYLYYGHQPFNLWGFPLWWGFVNPVMPMVAGALIFHIRPHLNTTWKLLAVIPCVPMADGIANGATAWPMWAALNQPDVSYVWTYLASFVTLGLALFSVWIIGLSVVGRGDLPHPESETLWQKLKAISAPSSRTSVPSPVNA